MPDANDVIEQYAYFTLIGEFDPSEITRRAGIPPTRAWRKGDRYRNDKLVRNHSRWSLYSRLPKHAELPDHIVDVLDQLDARATLFQELTAEYNGSLQLVAYYRHYNPGMYWEAGIVERLAQYKLSVDFDFYYLGPDDDDHDDY